MVNEFGSVGLDGDLIRSCGFVLRSWKGGSWNSAAVACCTVQDDFLPTMERLLEQAGNLDGIVVETGGLALPRPLLQALEWPAIRSRVHVNGVVPWSMVNRWQRAAPSLIPRHWNGHPRGSQP